MRWYCRYSLSYRDLEEMMRERGPTPATGEAREGMLSRLGPALARSRRRRGEG